MITMTNKTVITEDMLKDCDKNFLEGSFEGVENTPPVVTNRDDDLIQMMDQIKFLTTKISEKDREIGFLKQDVDRTLDQRQASQSMEIQVLRKKSQYDSKEIANLKYENEDLQCCLMTSMEDNDSLKKQIKAMKKTEKHHSTPDQKPVVEVKKEDLKMKSDIASLKSSIQQLDKKFLEAAHNNDILHKSNKSLLEKVDLLKDEVKEQKCKTSKSEFEVESLRRCKHDLTQQLQVLKCQEDNINGNSNAYNRPYQGFGSPNNGKYWNNTSSNNNANNNANCNSTNYNNTYNKTYNSYHRGKRNQQNRKVSTARNWQ